MIKALYKVHERSLRIVIRDNHIGLKVYWVSASPMKFASDNDWWYIPTNYGKNVILRENAPIVRNFQEKYGIETVKYEIETIWNRTPFLGFYKTSDLINFCEKIEKKLKCSFFIFLHVLFVFKCIWVFLGLC